MGILTTIGFNLVLVYVAYVLASWGEEVDLSDCLTCAIIIVACSVGASEAMAYTGTFGALLILGAYFICVGLAFALATGLPIKRSLIAMAVFIALNIFAQLGFWLIF